MTAPVQESMRERYDALRADLGKERSEPLGVVSRRDLQRFAVACGEPPLDASPEEPLAAPPLYVSSIMGWGAGPAEAELATDGTAAGDTRGLALGGLRLMGAGQDLEFHEPVREGTSVVVHTSLDDVRLKEGNSGPLLIVRLLRRFTDDGGNPLVTCRESFIAR